MANCGKCYKDVKRGDKIVPCTGLCERYFHDKCANVSSDEYALLGSKKNFGWFCDSCMEKKNYLRNIVDGMKSLSNLSEGMKKQNDKIEKLQNEVTMCNDNLKSNIKEIIEERKEHTYAEKLKLKKHEPVVIIKPKNQEQKSLDTKKEVRKSIDPTNLDISGVRSVSKGGIVIECKNTESVNKLKEKAESKLGDEYEIKIPKKKLPRVKLVGISEKISLETIEEKIKSQNSFLNSENAHVKIVHIKANKDRRSYTAFAEVNAYAYRVMLDEQKVNIGWDRCKIYDAVEITRCFTCSGFNHKASQCKSQKACPKCAGPHHLSECKAGDEDQRCINCMHAVNKLKIKLDVNHAAWSSECAVFKRKLELERSKIDFLE